MLDISTEKRQESLKLERLVINRIKEAWNVDIIETKKDTPSRIDNFLIKDNEISAVIEIKCTKVSLDRLNFYGSWLVSNQKIKDGARISRLLCVPFYGFFY